MRWNKIEIFDPIKDFYSMRTRRRVEICVFVALPICVALIVMFFELQVSAIRHVIIDELYNDLLNQLITVLTLFISFSMAYLSIIITSSGKSINDMKKINSKRYFLDKGKRPCNLYQVLSTDITYTLITEILFLMLIFFQKLAMYLFHNIMIKIFIALNVALLLHVLLLMMTTVKNIYYSFWNNVQGD